MRRTTLFRTTVAAVVAAAGIFWLVSFYSAASLSFSVLDRVSESWVWDSTIRIQDTYTRGFFQTAYTFTGLEPGQAILRISAPAYENFEMPVVLRRGRNIIEVPVYLTGKEIPGLADIVVFEETSEEGIISEYRLIDRQGRGIGYHPCLDIVIFAAVYDQIKAEKWGSARGSLLFQGVLPWMWDDRAEGFFRYSSFIDNREFTQVSSPYLVIDYLILFPETGMNKAGITRALIQKVLEKGDPEQTLSLVAGDKGVRQIFQFTSWNVPRHPL